MADLSSLGTNEKEISPIELPFSALPGNFEQIIITLTVTDYCMVYMYFRNKSWGCDQAGCSKKERHPIFKYNIIQVKIERIPCSAGSEVFSV